MQEKYKYRNEKQENIVQNKIQDFKNTFSKFHFKLTCEVGSV
jgi:hypothetical protein